MHSCDRYVCRRSAEHPAKSSGAICEMPIDGLVVLTVLRAASEVQSDDAISLRHRLNTVPIIIDSDRERFGAMRKDLRGSVFCSPRTGTKGPPSAVLAAVARGAGAPPGLLRSRTL